jgi:hypothetical protein
MTKMTVESVVDDVIQLPERFHMAHTVSAPALLKQMGYPAYKDRITESLIASALSRNSGSVEEWMQWSADKRTDAGWYFMERTPGEFVVGFFSKLGGHKNVVSFADRIQACATFVVHELEQLAPS